jgi:hypothetical protein
MPPLIRDGTVFVIFHTSGWRPKSLLQFTSCSGDQPSIRGSLGHRLYDRLPFIPYPIFRRSLNRPVPSLISAGYFSPAISIQRSGYGNAFLTESAFHILRVGGPCCTRASSHSPLAACSHQAPCRQRTVRPTMRRISLRIHQQGMGLLLIQSIHRRPRATEQSHLLLVPVFPGCH